MCRKVILMSEVINEFMYKLDYRVFCNREKGAMGLETYARSIEIAKESLLCKASKVISIDNSEYKFKFEKAYWSESRLDMEAQSMRLVTCAFKNGVKLSSQYFINMLRELQPFDLVLKLKRV